MPALLARVVTARRYKVRSASELRHILGAAYGAQQEDVVQRCHRGLRRVASALEAEDLALAGIEAVFLALPKLELDAMAKLATLADLEKGGEAWCDEPRLPAGQPGGGQWTNGGAGTSPARQTRTASHLDPHHGRVGQPAAKPRVRQSHGANAAEPPQRARVSNPPPEPSRSSDPVSAVVDFSNTVASRLVDATHWLQQPAGEVPIAPEIAAGEPEFPMGAAVEETTDPHAFRDWRPVSHLEVATGALSVAGAVADAATIVVDGAEAAGQVTRFSSAWKLKQYLGSPGAGNQWHHIVEQTPANLRAFGAEAIHSTDNIIAISKSVHVGKGSISAFYSSKPTFTGGLTIRQWLSTQSFEAQREYGITQLIRYRKWKW